LLDPENKYLSKFGEGFVLFLRNFVAYWLKLMRRIKFPGFDNLSLHDVLKVFFRGLSEGRLTIRASAISFDFFLALFPTIIFFFTIIPFVPIDNFQPTLLKLLEDIIPATLWNYVSTTLEDIITKPRSDLLSLGFILALYFSTNGINSIIEGFNQSKHITETRQWFKQRLICVFLVIVISVMIIVAISLLIIGGYVMIFLVDEGILTDNFTIIIIQVTRWLLIISLFLFSLSFLYYFAPAKRGTFKFVSPGSALATILFIITTYGFNFYIEHFSQYNALYGSIGTLLVFLLWISFNSFILLIGFELNVSISRAKKEKALR
jgi:membrane protein